MTLPPDLKAFVDQEKWTFAKTYAATWPHEYIVRERVDENLFIRLVQHIRTFGHQERFYSKRFTYYHEDGKVYWTMGEPMDETIIVNRCGKEQTYEYRLKHGTLPESKCPSAKPDAV
ncbi:MAG: hypothetical protein QM570_10960 [Planctomycetota bacterium]|nr:hypothetical protein [Planctomycetota bacterium]